MILTGLTRKAPPIVLYNTLTRAREPLHTERPDRVTMYVCGPTVYNFAHIGDARPAVVFDVLARLLRHDYARLIYARNFTDVDDKINAAAVASGLPIGAVTARYIEAYQADMHALGVVPPDVELRVTEHIPDIIALIQALIARGHAYIAQAHVLFDVASWPDYGQLSGRRPEDMLAVARVEVAPYKRNPLDFVLWKPSTPDLPGWSSPWGRGRPGWHVECSAMIGRHIGGTLDIHGGGQDLIFPHHENEIAQGSGAQDGALYCRTWVHNSFVTVDGQKMSKSLGNVLLVRDLLDRVPGEAIRLALLATHYRKPLDWNDRRLSQARQTLQRWYALLARIVPREEVEPDARLPSALRDDLNVPQAIVRLHELAITATHASGAEASPASGQLRASAAMLGLLQAPPSSILPALEQTTRTSHAAPLSTDRIAELVALRDEARREGHYAQADAVRTELDAAGVTLSDTAGGTHWQFHDERTP
ncbi:Cysteinyl-tRNA synthetase [Candidatus Burkholderia verschuerenii]|uniref:Cysteine--tRNA ligase n=1 Tax=Candidatus Burkholderia verschuerenii TaxID=242163 RepID=A0A0L0MA94_9BURK|nr:cysteine--tRNA ligase [Candidatus Burkholderia verschuerenii]KND59597.1 Cysteinyl-tRNA synthetase [Candidatus Burkholderia verschuerenii]